MGVIIIYSIFPSRVFRGEFDERGQSEVIGVVLLLSVTVVGITAVAAGGATVLGDAQTDSRVAQTGNSMSQMSSKANLVALGQSERHSFSLGNVGNGTVSTEEEGYITVSHNGRYIVKERMLGAVTYEEGSTTIAYQGGGVWKKEGDHAMMVSPPQFHYRGNTLTFPIVTLTGTGSASGLVSGQAEKVGEKTHYPGETGSNPLEKGEVTIKVQSRYCQGWQEFFESRTTGAVIESCDASNANTVEIRLKVPNPLMLESATTYTNFASTSGSGTIESEREVSSFPPVEPTIDDKIEHCTELEDNCRDMPASDGESLTPGEPYYIEVAENDRYSFGERDFKPDEGDVEVVINGDLEINEDLDVSGSENVKLYVNGDLSIQSADINAGESSGDASKMTMYVADQIDQPGSGSTEVHAIIYAPNNTTDNGCRGNERWSGNIDFYGAVFTESMCVGGGTNLYYQEGLTGMLDLKTESSLIQYLHITENEIEIEVS